MERQVLLLFSALMLCCGCAGSRSLESESDCETVVYDPEAGDGLLRSDLIRTVEIIPLQTLDSALLGTDPELIVDGTEYYLVDRNGSLEILRYDSIGRFLNRIGYRGKGPQEYLKISNVYVDPNTGNLSVFSSVDSKVCTYRKTGECVSCRKVGHRFQQGIPDEEGNLWLYLGYRNGTSDYRILKVDPQDRVIERWLDATPNVMPMEEMYSVFIPTVDNRLWLRESFDNRIGMLTETGVSPVYKFDFGACNVPQAYYTQSSPMEAATILMQQPFTVLDRMLESRNYVVVQAHVQRPDKAPILIYGLKHKGGDSWQWFNFEDPAENRSVGTNSIRGLTENDELICLVDPIRLLEMPQEDRAVFVNPDALSDLQEESNPVILKCRLK